MNELIIPMRGRMMHAVNGELTFQPYGKNESEVINSISRADLGIALMDAAEAEGVRIHFERRCTAFDPKSGTITLRDERNGLEMTHRPEVVIGCDGSASAIRGALIHLNRFNFSQMYLDYGYKELTIPSGGGGKHLLEVNALHIWPRGRYMLIALPNIDGSFACILFLPFEGKDSFAELKTEAGVERFFETQFPDAVRLMPRLTENYFANPVGSMVTIRCSPWHVGGTALLLGDAAHAIVPFFGQGINCGFEDCTSLLELIDQFGEDWERVFSEFQLARKANTDAIADMAIENFIEMRDRVANPRFLLRKKVELALEAKFPTHFVPRYAMVTFHRIPYAVALSRGAIQDRILEELCGSIDNVSDVDWRLAERLVYRELTGLEQAS